MIDKRRFRYQLAHCSECGNTTDDIADLFCKACRPHMGAVALEREQGHQAQIRNRLAELKTGLY